MDLSKLSMGDKLIAGGGILLLVFSFFPWLGFSYASFSASKSAWGFTITLIAVILGVAMVAYVGLVKLQGVQFPDLGITWAQVILIVATVAFVFILIKLITGPGTGGVSLAGSGVSKERKIGIFLGLIASGGQLAGAFLNAKEAGELPSWLGGSKGGTA